MTEPRVFFPPPCNTHVQVKLFVPTLSTAGPFRSFCSAALCSGLPHRGTLVLWTQVGFDQWQALAEERLAGKARERWRYLFSISSLLLAMFPSSGCITPQLRLLPSGLPFWSSSCWVSGTLLLLFASLGLRW